jgi:hypothetical protein
MYLAKQAFDSARKRGDEYIIIIQKRQTPGPNLTFAVTGSKGKCHFAQMEFCSSGPYSGGNNWGYSYVAMFNTSEPWEEHEAYLRAVDFHW